MFWVLFVVHNIPLFTASQVTCEKKIFLKIENGRRIKTKKKRIVFSIFLTKYGHVIKWKLKNRIKCIFNIITQIKFNSDIPLNWKKKCHSDPLIHLQQSHETLWQSQDTVLTRDRQVYFAFINLFLYLCTKTTHSRSNLAFQSQILLFLNFFNFF